MSLSLQKKREILFQLLYGCDSTNEIEEESIIFIMQLLKVTKKSVKEAILEIEELWKNKEELDGYINKSTTSYKLERISKVELTVLRLGIYEIVYKKIPPKVVISEAIRLCRKFSTIEGANFVNAILDEFYKKNCS